MTLKAIPRTVVDHSIRLVRLPADSLLGLVGGGRTVGAVKLGLDRAEAAVRAGAGTVLGDDTLVHDARRRRSAADERERAVKLRVQADARTATAEEMAESREAQAEQRERRAAETAKRKRVAADKRRKATARQASKAAHSRAQAAEESADRKTKAADQTAKRERLKQLDTKQHSLNEKEAALAASREADRLADAAANAKAARKR